MPNILLFLEFICIFSLPLEILTSPVSPGIHQVPNLFQDPDVFFTISPNASYSGNELFDRRIQLNWYNFFTTQNDDFIGLYLENPLASDANLSSPVQSVLVNSEDSGQFTTFVRYERQNLTAGSNTCRGYWIAYVRKVNEILSVEKSKCLEIYPRWMNDLKESIGDKPLNSIMIPGTHNAGSWKKYDGLSSENVLVKYMMCQEDTIYDQLMHGIRYLDIRVANYNGEFWLNHGSFRVRPLMEVFNNVKAFLVESPNEVIILDFHGLENGFDDEKTHLELLDFVQAELGDLLLSKNDADINVTPNQMLGLGKNIILGYADDSVQNRYDFLWKNVNHAWADTTVVPDLLSYLNDSIRELGCSGRFWSAMTELTPKDDDIFQRPNFGLRGFSDLVNPILSYWYHQPEWYSRSAIVASDFYLGNDIINIAVKVNGNRASCKI